MQPGWKRRTAAVLVVVVGLGSTATGCTLIGAVIGHKADVRRGHSFVSRRVEALRIGRLVRVTPSAGEPVEGFFMGLEPESGEPGLVLPRVGEPITVEFSGRSAAGRFVSLDVQRIVLGAPPEGPLERIDLKRVTRLDLGPRGSVDGEHLRAALADGRVDPAARLAVGDARIARSDVQLVQYARRGRSGLVAGLLLGLAADAVVLVAVLIPALEDAFARAAAESLSAGSCPHVASFDGAAYRLEAEAFPRAFVPAAPQRDRVVLRHLRAAEGELRLHVSNAQDEIQYVDELALLAVDHRPGTRLVAALDGRLYAVAAPWAPSRAHDRTRRDWRAVLAHADGRYWATDPLGVAARAGRFETLELEFPRPAEDPAAARLLVSLRGSAWGYWLLSDVLALHGRALPAFEQRLASDPAARRALVQAHAREALPRVEVWDGSGWRHAGVIANAGTAVNREQAVALDLGGIPAGPLRVRLAVPPGTWLIDSVALDGTPQPAVDVQRLGLLRARGDDGQDRRAQVEGADGNVAVMPPYAGAFEAVFAAPAAPARGARSFVLQATGSYRMLVPAQGEPRAALFERLVREPGAVLRHGARRLDQLAGGRTAEGQLSTFSSR